MARQALETIPELALEEVDDEAVITHAPDLPLLLARYLYGQLLKLSFPLRCGVYLRLLQHAVEVLM